jgi:hypothetical protein
VLSERNSHFSSGIDLNAVLVAAAQDRDFISCCASPDGFRLIRQSESDEGKADYEADLWFFT